MHLARHAGLTVANCEIKNFDGELVLEVDEALKEKSYSILKEQGISPTDFFTNILEYVATTGKLPVQKALLSEEDAELLALVRKRMNDPKEMFEEVTLDDL